MMTIGVLALQGAFKEHVQMIQRLGHHAVEVRTLKELSQIQGLIIPGGESTTMSKLLIEFDLMTPIKTKILKGLPVMGTCAGLILLAKEIDNDAVDNLGVLSVSVKRNAYGRQLGSFTTLDPIPTFSECPIPLVFIRAPLISTASDHVKVLHRVNNEIVAVRENNILGVSFHPELTDNTKVHEYFLNMITTQ